MNYFAQYVATTGEELGPGAENTAPYAQSLAAQIGPNASPMANPYQSPSYFSAFPDPIMFEPPKTHSGRSRRKSAPGLDHVKHRRTRSGCYTCRGRRVKCDETHPVCERCRKGKRECKWPEPPAAKGPGGAKEAPDARLGDSPISSSGEHEEDTDKDVKLEPIPDVEESEVQPLETRKASKSSRRPSAASNLNLQKTSTRHSSETPSLDDPKSSSPSTATSASFAIPLQSSDLSMQLSPPNWSHLPSDVGFYLDYFRENLSHLNYFYVNDAEDFFGSILPSVAIRSGNEALLYALVGFSAYHYTIHNPNGRIQDFLQYYNKSVTLLLNTFKRREKQDTVTLLAILQLATIEEYLGDWVNLMGHQKAALQIITQLFTPQSAMQSPASRMLLTWYVRFDVFVGMMGGFETRLPREWFLTTVEYYENQVANSPSDLSWRIEAAAATLRLISVDMTSLYAKRGRGEVTADECAVEHGQLSSRLYAWRDNLDPALTDHNYRVTEFGNRQPLTEDDIVDPYAEGYLYEPPLFSTTILLAQWHSILVLHKSQAAATLPIESSEELRNLSYAVCQIFAAVERWPSTPNGGITILHPSLAMTALLLPQDAKHHMWMRRKFAAIEATGYITPLRMRTRMAELFRDPTCRRWWLPNDEGFGPVLREIRAFADERNSNPVSEQTENLREMSAVFAKMRLTHEDNLQAGQGRNSKG